MTLQGPVRRHVEGFHRLQSHTMQSLAGVKDPKTYRHNRHNRHPPSFHRISHRRKGSRTPTMAARLPVFRLHPPG